MEKVGGEVDDSLLDQESGGTNGTVDNCRFVCAGRTVGLGQPTASASQVSALPDDASGADGLL